MEIISFNEVRRIISLGLYQEILFLDVRDTVVNIVVHNLYPLRGASHAICVTSQNVIHVTAKRDMVDISKSELSQTPVFGESSFFELLDEVKTRQEVKTPDTPVKDIWSTPGYVRKLN